MSYEVVIYPEVRKDLTTISKPIQERIKKAIEIKLMSSPELYGKPLRRSLHGYFKLRVGDYRIIYKIVKNTVEIFIIGHRSWVYEKMGLRI